MVSVTVIFMVHKETCTFNTMSPEYKACFAGPNVLFISKTDVVIHTSLSHRVKCWHAILNLHCAGLFEQKLPDLKARCQDIEM